MNGKGISGLPTLSLSSLQPEMAMGLENRLETRRPKTWYYTELPDFPVSSEGKEYALNVGDQGSIPGSGRSPGEGNSNPLQYSCLENSMDRGAWTATLQGVTELDTTE